MMAARHRRAVRRAVRQRRQRHRVRRARRAARLRRRVRARPAVRASVEPDHRARRSPRIKGMTGTLARENAARNPKRTATTATARDHRCRARRVHHDLRGVGEGVDRRRDRLAVQHRLHRHRARAASRPASASARRWRQQIAALPEVEAATPLRARRVRAERQPQLPRARSTRDRPTELFDLGDVAGSLSAISTTTASRVSKRKADDNDWKIGDDDPGHVREDRRSAAEGRLHLQGEHVRRLLHLARHLREELRRSARLPRLRQAEARRVAGGRAARRSKRSPKPYPNAKVQDNAEFKADQKSQINTFVALDLRVAVPRGVHRADRHRQHDGAVDLRTNARARAAARGRNEPSADAIDGPLGVGDHLAARHAHRPRDRSVLRLERRAGAAATKASPTSRSRRRSSSSSWSCSQSPASAPRSSPPAAPPSSTSCAPSPPSSSARRRRLDGVWRRRWLGAALVAVAARHGMLRRQDRHRDDDTGGVGAMRRDRDQTVRGA